MLNTIVPAAGEAMPRINRRSLLLGLAAASTMAASATDSPAAISESENPELIRLAGELPEVAARYVEAQKHQVGVEVTYSSVWPVAPDEITKPGYEGAWGGFEKTFKGGGMFRKGEVRPRQLISASSFRYDTKYAKRVLNGNKLEKSKIDGLNRQEWEVRLVQLEKAQALAARYEAEIKRIKSSVDYEAVWRATHAARDALEDHIAAIMNEPEQTMTGLIIKAQALEAWGQVKGYKIPFRHGEAWPEQIAASILRMARSGRG